MTVTRRKAKENASLAKLHESAEGDALYCQPCDTEGQRVPAFGNCTDCGRHICESCFNSPKKSKPCRHHNAVQKTQQLPSTPQQENGHQTHPVLDSTLDTQSPRLQLEGEIGVKTPEDVSKCRVTGITVLKPKYLALADNFNKCVKMVDVNSKKVVYRLPLPSEPWDLTTVSSEELAVSLPYKKIIQFISASVSDSRSLTRSFIVKGQCFGITCCQDKLVVAFPRRLEILDVNGLVLTTIKTGSDGEKIFKYPEYVTSTHTCICVSDWGKKAVIMLDWEGNVTGRTVELDCPQGLEITTGGQIYVCESKRDRIAQISPDCTKLGRVLHDLRTPKAICHSVEDNQLYIAEGFGITSSIKIFTLS